MKVIASLALGALVLGGCAALSSTDPLDPRGDWRSVSGQETFLRVDAAVAEYRTWNSVERCYRETPLMRADSAGTWAYDEPGGAALTVRVNADGHLVATREVAGETATRTFRRTSIFTPSGCDSPMRMGLQPGSGLPHPERTWKTFEPDRSQ